MANLTVVDVEDTRQQLSSRTNRAGRHGSPDCSSLHADALVVGVVSTTANAADTSSCCSQLVSPFSPKPQLPDSRAVTRVTTTVYVK
jgi:hypothetical protein